MKTKTIRTKKKSWALPGEPITINEFKAGIKEAVENVKLAKQGKLKAKPLNELLDEL